MTLKLNNRFTFKLNQNESILNRNLSRFSAETYLKHPNSYLPKYNVQSETDGETTPLNANGKNRNSGTFESEEELEDHVEEGELLLFIFQYFVGPSHLLIPN